MEYNSLFGFSQVWASLICGRKYIKGKSQKNRLPTDLQGFFKHQQYHLFPEAFLQNSTLTQTNREFTPEHSKWLGVFHDISLVGSGRETRTCATASSECPVRCWQRLVFASTFFCFKVKNKGQHMRCNSHYSSR